ELFTQLDDRLNRARGGLGIGLALVKQLVTMHGGTVAGESAGIDKGSLFSVRLPSVDRPAEHVSPEAAAEASLARSLKVLVVDDNAAVAQALGWMLETIGHDYQLVHEGPSAIQAAGEFGPDAILLDIGLPGMDGYAVCREFRRDERFKNIPIIAQTGWGQERDKALASDAGFDHHLVKHVAIEDLERLLADLVPTRT